MPTAIDYEKSLRFPIGQLTNPDLHTLSLVSPADYTQAENVRVVNIQDSAVLGRMHEDTSKLKKLSDEGILASLHE